MMSTKNCSICGEEISSEAEICPKCGVRPAGLVVQSDVSKLYWPQDRINPSIGNWSMNASIGEIGSTDINSNYSVLAVLVNTKTDTDFYNKSLTKNGIRLSDYAIEKKAEVKVTRKW